MGEDNSLQILCIAALVALTACGTLPKERLMAGQPIPSRYEIGPVPFFAQKQFQCGPASLTMVFAWNGLQADPSEVASQVFTASQKGSLQLAMIAAARRHAMVAYPISGFDALFSELSAGHPVIVLQNLGLSWIPKWHYAVAVGYDLDKGIVILHSANIARKELSLSVFNKTWARSGYWGLLVLAPTCLPATATEETFVTAVLGLEKAGQPKAAIEGYKTALTRWPRNAGALIGLGNSFYATSDKDAAEAAFRVAAARLPNNGAAFNNLAQVLWEKNMREEALIEARRAVELGGPNAGVYKDTLEQIERDLHIGEGK